MTPEEYGHSVHGKVMLDVQSNMIRWIASAITEATADLCRQRDELREAIRPFAAEPCRNAGGCEHGGGNCYTCAARAALERAKEGK